MNGCGSAQPPALVAFVATCPAGTGGGRLNGCMWGAVGADGGPGLVGLSETGVAAKAVHRLSMPRCCCSELGGAERGVAAVVVLVDSRADGSSEPLVVAAARQNELPVGAGVFAATAATGSSLGGRAPAAAAPVGSPESRSENWSTREGFPTGDGACKLLATPPGGTPAPQAATPAKRGVPNTAAPPAGTDVPDDGATPVTTGDGEACFPDPVPAVWGVGWL